VTSERRLGAIVATGFGVLIAVGVTAALGFRLWLGSQRGQRAVQQRLDTWVAQKSNGRLHVGKISGSLVSGVRLDSVELYDRKGRVALRAASVRARYSAAQVLAGRPVLQVDVDRPELDVDALTSGEIDLESLTRVVEHEGERTRRFTLDKLMVHDGTLRSPARHQSLTHVELEARATLDQENRLGDRGAMSLLSMKAYWHGAHGGAPVGASGTVRWSVPDRRLDADALTLRVGQSHVQVRGDVRADEVDLRLATLSLAPEELLLFAPTATPPRRPITGEGRAVGPLDAIVVRGTLRPDHGEVQLRGRLDANEREGQLHLLLDRVESDFAPVVVSGVVALRGKLEEGGGVAWRAHGSYQRREIDPNLQVGKLGVDARRRFALARPGGHFSGSGRAVFGEGVRMKFRLEVDDPGQAARLVAGPDVVLPSRTLHLRGTYVKPAAGRPSLVVRRVDTRAE